MLNMTDPATLLSEFPRKAVCATYPKATQILTPTLVRSNFGVYELWVGDDEYCAASSHKMTSLILMSAACMLVTSISHWDKLQPLLSSIQVHFPHSSLHFELLVELYPTFRKVIALLHDSPFAHKQGRCSANSKFDDDKNIAELPHFKYIVPLTPFRRRSSP